MKTTKIEWIDKTWNPITGCTKHSAGCAHCYAEVMSRRLHAMGLAKYTNGFQLRLGVTCESPAVKHRIDALLQNQCEKQGATFFFKQWGTWGSDGIKRSKHENGKLLKGKVWQAMPA